MGSEGCGAAQALAGRHRYLSQYYSGKRCDERRQRTDQYANAHRCAGPVKMLRHIMVWCMLMAS